MTFYFFKYKIKKDNLNNTVIYMNKIVIAMSGGVDSSAAAVILKRNGYSPVGAMLNLLEKSNKNDIEDAKNICEKLDIQFNLDRKSVV